MTEVYRNFEQISPGNFRPIKPNQRRADFELNHKFGSKERRFSMSLKMIAARFPDAPAKFGAPQERRVLTTLKMIYEGGSLDGKAANFPTRDVTCVVVGRHHGNWHSFETYKRTIWINLRTGRTIFRCAGRTVKSNTSNRWKSLLALLRLRRLKAIII
jgi:hypothetical protein